MTRLAACRACLTPNPTVILSLGETPLANALLRESQLGQPEPTYPLDLMFCSDCTLVQIGHVVSPDQLFRHYPYYSSVAETTVVNAHELVGRLIEWRRLGAGNRVIEIASNDGYLLQWYRRERVPVLGIEPALNIAQTAEQRGITTISEFFDSALAHRLKDDGQPADVIHANNVLAHVADLKDFLEGIAVLLKPGGIVVIEVPYVRDMIENNAFDTIYHEHVWYFSVTSIERLLRNHALRLVRVERIPIHGGSLRLFATRAETCDSPEEDAASVHRILAEESQHGLNRLEFYSVFSERVLNLRERLITLMTQLKAEKKRIAAYGASAKGTTLMTYCGIDREMIDFVVDRNRFKQQHYTPGTRLPIYPPTMLLEKMPDYVLLLTWNFAHEILGQQDAYRNQGGRFIIPIPEVQVV
jgi:SAM-dependent methyltransferase